MQNEPLTYFEWKEQQQKRRENAFTLAMLAVIALAVAVLTITGCRAHAPGTPSYLDRVVDCSTQQVRDCWPSALPATNTCLANLGDWQSCLAALISPAGCVTADVLACVVRQAGSVAAASAAANSDDAVSERIATRARSWITDNHVTYRETP